MKCRSWVSFSHGSKSRIHSMNRLKAKMMKGLIQVAGVIDQDEADMLIACGVDWLGFPLRLKLHQEDLSDEGAAQIIASLKPPNHGILITYLANADDITALCRKLGTSKVQLHGEIPRSEIARLRRDAPHLFLIKSLIVRGDNDDELIDCVDEWSPHVDAFITDTFDPVTEACGATGQTHDWLISRRLVERSPHPIILAGGLTPDNVRAAIETVKPAGVDVHTGLEGRDGRKDERLVRRFVQEGRAAFEQIYEVTSPRP